MSTDDYVKRETYIRKNYKYIIPLAKWLARTVVSLDASSADADHPGKQSKLDEDDQREYQSSSEEDTFALFALNCLLFISSAATSETTLTPLCDIFVDQSQSALLQYLNNRLYTGRANDSHIGILVNFTRYMPFVDRLVESIIPRFPNFVSKLVSFLRAPETVVEHDIAYNNKQLISAYLTNLTQAESIRSLLVDEKLFSSLLLVYENNRIDVEVKKAAISIIRNCCFDSATHPKMISEDDDEVCSLPYRYRSVTKYIFFTCSFSSNLYIHSQGLKNLTPMMSTNCRLICSTFLQTKLAKGTLKFANCCWKLCSNSVAPDLAAH